MQTPFQLTASNHCLTYTWSTIIHINETANVYWLGLCLIHRSLLDQGHTFLYWLIFAWVVRVQRAVLMHLQALLLNHRLIQCAAETNRGTSQTTRRSLQTTSHVLQMTQLHTLCTVHTKPISNNSCCHIQTDIQCESTPPLRFSDIFPKWLGIFSPNFTCLLYVVSTLDYKFLFN